MITLAIYVRDGNKFEWKTKVCSRFYVEREKQNLLKQPNVVKIRQVNA